MAKKVYLIDNLDCANCAAKIEAKFNAHPQVQEAVITFATKQLRLTAEDPDLLIPELMTIARSVERGATILPWDRDPQNSQQSGKSCGCGHNHAEHPECGCGHHHEDHQGCSCGHDHEDHQGCSCGHDHGESHGCCCGHSHEDHQGCGCGCSHDHGNEDDEKRTVLTGACLFAAGVLLNLVRLSPVATLCFLLSYLVLGREVVMTAFRNLTRGNVFDENFLMSLATIGAFLIGEAPEAAGVMLFYRVGEYFEHKAVERSRSQIMEAVDLRPEVVRLVQGDSVKEIPARDAQVGDLLLVRPGDRIPLDGKVTQGESRMDTSPITGEPVPVSVSAGSSVTSGCINTAGQLIIQVEKTLSESMVTRILDSVENAAASKPKIDRFITRFSRIYTPIVVAAATATAVIPSLITGDWGYWVYTALTFLVMSCPCALVLSVPLAFFAGIGAGSKKGILFKGGQSMEALQKVKAVVLDKTGTITKGNFQVQTVVGGMPLLHLCACCEQHSTHPIAESIVAAAKKQKLTLIQPENLEELPGMGIRAIVSGSTVLCGNHRLMKEEGISVPQITDSGTLVLVAVDGEYKGYLVIDDTLKPGAEPAIRKLKDQGIDAVMLTGDAASAAKAVAGKVGIREIYPELLPHQKLERLQGIRKQKGAVMFVGDGINDAPVLAGADVGAAMGSGADAAIEAADVVFMTSDMEAIPQALDIAAQTWKIAWQNVIFALGIKFAVMILGLMGYASMWLAVFADSGVAMLCVLNSIRLLYKK